MCVSETTMWRSLRRLGLTRKRAFCVSQRARPDVVGAHERFEHRLRRWRRSRVWFVDESGSICRWLAKKRGLPAARESSTTYPDVAGKRTR